MASFQGCLESLSSPVAGVGPPHNPHLQFLSLSNGFIPLLQDLLQGRLCPGVPQCSSCLGFWVCWRVMDGEAVISLRQAPPLVLLPWP